MIDWYFYKRIFLGILLTLIFFPEVYAQRVKKSFVEGYIVAFSGDTTQGYIRSGNLFKDQQKIRFFDRFGHKVVYVSDRIAAFGYEGKHYVSQAIPYNFAGLFSDSTLFLLRLVNGPAVLYRFYTRRTLFTLQKGPAYFDLIKMPDNELYEISYNFKWKRIAEIFRDFPELSQAIKDEVYKPEETPEIVEQYNEWYMNQDQ